jgi:hypothetical protein
MPSHCLAFCKLRKRALACDARFVFAGGIFGGNQVHWNTGAGSSPAFALHSGAGATSPLSGGFVFGGAAAPAQAQLHPQHHHHEHTSEMET